MGLHPAAARALSQAFEHHTVRKRYLALVRGWFPDSAAVDHALRPDDAPPDTPAQPAQTHFCSLARLELPESSDPRFAHTRASLVHAVPLTGRRHQIRRHLKHLAHPIIGDATHGKGPLNRAVVEFFEEQARQVATEWAEPQGFQRLWLHALELRLQHPLAGGPPVWASSACGCMPGNWHCPTRSLANGWNWTAGSCSPVLPPPTSTTGIGC